MLVVIFLCICSVLSMFRYMMHKYMPADAGPITATRTPSVIDAGGLDELTSSMDVTFNDTKSHLALASLNGTNGTVPCMFFRTRLAGFNNQLQEVVAAIALASTLKWCIVLPFFGEQITWDHNVMDRIYPFEDYFDTSALAKMVPIISTKAWLLQCNRTLDLDISHITCARKEKRDLTNPQYDTRLGIQVKSTTQEDNWKTLLGHKASIPACFGLNWPRCFSRPILRFKTRVGTPKWVLAFETSVKFQEVWRTLVPAHYVHSLAMAVVREAKPYIAIHIRVGDFNKWCKQTGGAAFKCPTLPTMFNDTLTISRLYKTSKVFIACDPRYLPGVLSTFGTLQQQEASQLSFFSLPPAFDKLRPDVKSIAEQTICAHAVAFAGNSYSTWTHTVHYMRRLQNNTCETSHMWMRAPRFACA